MSCNNGNFCPSLVKALRNVPEAGSILRRQISDVDDGVGVDAEALHVAVVGGHAHVVEEKEEGVKALRVVRQEVEHPPVLLDMRLGVGLEGVDDIGKLDAVADEDACGARRCLSQTCLAQAASKHARNAGRWEPLLSFPLDAIGRENLIRPRPSVQVLQHFVFFAYGLNGTQHCTYYKEWTA